MSFIVSVFRLIDFFEWIPLDHVPFSQDRLLRKLNHTKHKQLIEAAQNYKGLCELICNRVLIDNLMTKGNNPELLKTKITISKINKQQILTSHILLIYSIFHMIIAFLFGIYPDNLFSCFDQWNLVNKSTKTVNRELLKKEVKIIAEEETIKLHVFHRNWTQFEGHSLLIKKMPGDKYAIFDPNTGEDRRLSFPQLCDRIDQQLKSLVGTNLFFMKGETFLKRINP